MRPGQETRVFSRERLFCTEGALTSFSSYPPLVTFQTEVQGPVVSLWPIGKVH